MIKELKGINGHIELHEDKIVVVRKWYHPGFSSGNRAIPFQSITSVRFKEPHLLTGGGYIQFALKGSIDKVYDDFMLAAKDENVILFKKKYLPNFQELKAFVEQKITYTPTQATTAPNYEELEKLSDLLKKGIITEEEFNTKKKQILGL